MTTIQPAIQGRSRAAGRPSTLRTASKRASTRPTRRPQTLRSLVDASLTSVAGARDAVKKLDLEPRQLPTSMRGLLAKSEPQARLFARGVLANWTGKGADKRAVEEAAALVAWARRGGARERKLIVRVFRDAGKNVHVVHNIGAMSRTHARAFMRTYFSEGGSIRDVAEWMREAGQVFRDTRSKKKKGLFGRIGGWLRRAVRTVGDAVRAAGRSLTSAVTAALRWSAKKTADFLDALVRAGQSIGAVLTAAVKRGLPALKKFVRAAIDVGRRASEIFTWASPFAAARRYAKRIRAVLDGLLRSGVTLFSTIRSIVRDVVHRFKKGFFEGLKSLGYSAYRIMKEALKGAGAIAAGAFATLMETFGGHRGLTYEERRQARRLFGTSLDLDRVKIAVASIPADLINLVNGGRPFTTMYAINFSSRARIRMKTLMHEMVHVWQGAVDGPVYMVEALEAQIRKGRDAYKVTNQMLAESKRLASFNREQQAVIGEEYWWERWGQHEFPPTRTRGLDLELLRPYAREFTSLRPVLLPPE